MSNYSSNDVANAIAAAAKALDARKDEINRLNVFPVPDGDTGTNMSLTLAMVVENLAALPIGASNADKRRAITTGALMGARGNSGVITSQILRGLCEGFDGHEDFDIDAIGDAFAKAVEVAFNAVRKPVEGTILTVRAIRLKRRVREEEPPKPRRISAEYRERCVCFRSAHARPASGLEGKRRGRRGWLWPCDLLRLVRCCSYGPHRSACRRDGVRAYGCSKGGDRADQ